jgi:hypothetical protein
MNEYFFIFIFLQEQHIFRQLGKQLDFPYRRILKYDLKHQVEVSREPSTLHYQEKIMLDIL